MMDSSVENTAKILAILGKYAVAFREEIDTPAFKIYAQSLRMFDSEIVESAMSRLVLKVKWFPKVAEIYDEISAMQSKDVDGYTAWENALEVVDSINNSFGAERKPFLNKEVEKAARRFGLYILENMDSKTATQARKQFIEMYNAILKEKKDKQMTEQLCPMLGGSETKLLR